MIKIFKCLINRIKLHKRIKTALRDYKMLLKTQIFMEEHKRKNS